MNYRQWKKNYKKQHGHNPPANEDKRKIKKHEGGSGILQGYWRGRE